MVNQRCTITVLRTTAKLGVLISNRKTKGKLLVSTTKNTKGKSEVLISTLGNVW